MAADRSRQIIRSTVSRLRWRKGIAVCSLVSAAGVLLLLAACWLDWWLTFNPAVRQGIRLSGLILAAAAVAGLAGRRRPSGKEAARLREASEPFWRGRLLALAESEEGELRLDPGLKNLIEEQLEAVAAARNPPRYPARLTTSGQRLGAAVLALLVAATAWSLPIGRLFGRLLRPGAGLEPARTLLLTVAPGDAEVERGEPLLITVGVDGGRPREVRVAIRREGEPERILEPEDEEETYRFYLPAVTRSFTYFAAADGTSSPLYSVTALEYPRLEEISAGVTIPEYAGGLTLVQRGGPLSVPAGSTVKLEGRATVDLAEAGLELADREGEEILSLRSPGRGPYFEFDLAPCRDGEYEISLLSGEGRPGREDYRYPLRIRPDRPPGSRIIRPFPEVREIPTAYIPFAWEADDDWGVAGARLAVRSPREGRSAPRSVSFPEPDRKTVSGEFLLGLFELGLSPGDVAAVQVEATDHLGQRGLSAPSFVQVIHYELELSLPSGAADHSSELRLIYIPIKGLVDTQRRVTARIMEAEGEERPDPRRLIELQEGARGELDLVLGELESRFPQGIPHDLYPVVAGLEDAGEAMDGAILQLGAGDLAGASDRALEALNLLSRLQEAIEHIILPPTAVTGEADRDPDPMRKDPFPDGLTREELEQLRECPRKALAGLARELEEQSRELEREGGRLEEEIEQWLRDERERAAEGKEFLREVIERAGAMTGEQFSYLKDLLARESGRSRFEEMGFAEAAGELAESSGGEAGRRLAQTLEEIRRLGPEKRGRLEYELEEKGLGALEAVREELSAAAAGTLEEKLSGRSTAGELEEKASGLEEGKFQELVQNLRRGGGREEFRELGFSPPAAADLEARAGGTRGGELARAAEELRDPGPPLSPRADRALAGLEGNVLPDLARLSRFALGEIAGLIHRRLTGREFDRRLGPSEEEALEELADAFGRRWSERIERVGERREEMLGQCRELGEADLTPRERDALRDLETTLSAQQERLSEYGAGHLGRFAQRVLPGEALLRDSLRRLRTVLEPASEIREELEVLAEQLRRRPVPERFRNLVQLYYRYLLGDFGDDVP